MFREMRRAKQALTKEECIEILTKAPRGVLAIHGEDGYPYAFPMNPLYVDGKIYFHSAKEGYKIDALAANNKVSFCIMNEGFRKEGEWSLNISSVIIFGTIKKVESNAETMEILSQLGHKHYPTAEGVERTMFKYAKDVQMLELTIDSMSGKLVDES